MHTQFMCRRTIAFGLLLSAGVACHEDAEPPTEPTTEAQPSVTAAASAPLVFRQISAGGTHTCGVTTDNRAFCWGQNATGEVGDGTTEVRRKPTPVAGALRFRQISAGWGITCAVTTEDLGYCWGLNADGQLGTGSNAGPETCVVTFEFACSTRPLPVAGARKFRQISASGHGSHSCAVTTGNQAFCWGNGFFGELGAGSFDNSSSPVAVLGGLRFRQVSAGGQHTCALTTDDVAYCWGDNGAGQVGDGSELERIAQPSRVAGSHLFRTLDAGFDHTCAATTANRGYCWGDGHAGEIGDGKTILRFTPRLVAGGLALTRLTAGGGVTANGGHSCGETSGNRAYCWGLNTKGQVGDGTTTRRLTPVPVSGSLTFSQVDVGTAHSCGVTPQGRAYCWGLNRFGQLGDGTLAKRLVPAPVAGPI